MHIEKLPTELIAKIFESCDLFTRYELHHTSRRHMKIAKRYDFLSGYSSVRVMRATADRLELKLVNGKTVESPGRFPDSPVELPFEEIEEIDVLKIENSLVDSTILSLQKKCPKLKKINVLKTIGHSCTYFNPSRLAVFISRYGIEKLYLDGTSRTEFLCEDFALKMYSLTKVESFGVAVVQMSDRFLPVLEHHRTKILRLPSLRQKFTLTSLLKTTTRAINQEWIVDWKFGYIFEPAHNFTVLEYFIDQFGERIKWSEDNCCKIKISSNLSKFEFELNTSFKDWLKVVQNRSCLSVPISKRRKF